MVRESEGRVRASFLERGAFVHTRQIEGVIGIAEGTLAILESWTFFEAFHVHLFERASVVLESRAVLDF